MNKKIFIYALFIVGFQSIAGQNAISSLNINICNVQLSSNVKTLSYDVYLRSVNKDTTVAIVGFIFRLIIPQADLGTKAKIIFITNATKELGSCSETITASGTNWIMKFLNGNMVMSYSGALAVSSDYPGTRIGTVNVANADGSSFSDPLTVNLNYSGAGLKDKTTCSVFKPNTTILADNSTTAQPASNFTGLGYYLLPSGGITAITNLAANDFWINIGDKTQEMRLFDMNGKLVLSKMINKNTNVNISFLPSGVYLININGIQKKLVKK